MKSEVYEHLLSQGKNHVSANIFIQVYFSLCIELGANFTSVLVDIWL